MPNLGQHDVTQWLSGWQKGTGSGWPPLVRAIEAETSVETRIIQLGFRLDDAAAADLQALSDCLREDGVADGLREVLAQLGAARTLRLLHWLSEADLPERGTLLSILLRHDGPAGAALRVVIEALRRQQVLGRLFAPERLVALELACTEALEETGQ